MLNLPYNISVIDNRPDDSPSLSTLPKLGATEIDRLMEFYGFKFQFDLGMDLAVSPGDVWWGFGAIELKEGHAVLQPAVFGLTGDKLVGPEYDIAGFLSYPNHPEALHPDWQPRYYPRGQVWWTKGSGDTGLGFGPESHIGDDGGPFRVWVSERLPPSIPGTGVGSDLIYDLGWWDNHIIPNPWFRLMTKGAPPPTSNSYLVTRDASGKDLYHVQLTPGGPPSGVSAHVVVVNGEDVLYTKTLPGSPIP